MRNYTAVGLSLLLVVFIACGDSPTDGTTPTSVATTTVLSAAEIALEILGLGGGISDQGNLFIVGVQITESGGVGASINFARLEVFRATGEFLERREVGAGQIIAGVGDNRLEANTSEEASIGFPFGATAKPGRSLLLTMGFTDDSGNDSEETAEFTIG